MTFASLPLFAGRTQEIFEWGRIQSNSDWILPIAACVAVMVFVRYMYRRDAEELSPALGWLLTAIRTVVFLGLLVIYLQPRFRKETVTEVIHNSRTLLLVDTSLSMGLSDADLPGGRTSRARRVADALEKTDFLAQLRRTHDVVVRQFGENLDRDRVVTLEKLPGFRVQGSGVGESRESGVGSRESGVGSRESGVGSRESGVGSRESGVGSRGSRLRSRGDPRSPIPDPRSPIPDPRSPTAIDWYKFLTPTGTSTGLGQALRQLIHQEHKRPLSGIVVFTDGGQNTAGAGPQRAVALAQEAKIPIFTVGIGSSKNPRNVRVSDLVAPSRAYPGDSYTVTGYVQAQQLAGQVVDVELLRRPALAPNPQPLAPQLIDRQQVALAADGEVVPVTFELTADETGRHTLCFRVRPLPGDGNPEDNYYETDVEVVDRKNHVLLIGGGPTREYRFLRTLLYRDRSTTLDVLLQTGRPGISQEADKLLDDFPTDRQKMFDYDCVVALDPDWQALSVGQIDLLEQWVAEEGGGLIVVAGAVFTGKAIGGWIEDPAMAAVRALYPVEFPRRFSVLQSGMYVADEPWPIDFTREGLEAEFLWLADTATAGRAAWSGFPGVYSYCPVRGPKPGATVLGRFSDPRAGEGSGQPVFFAGQFYGSGRVFYIGSGEMWRLRRLDENYFGQLYTKLIRHVSQGRLLRGSSRGVLLVGQDRYLLGNTVEVRAQLKDVRHQPLEVPSVALQVIGPDGAAESLTLGADPSRDGTYAGRFTVLEEGVYRLELPVPESDDQRLIQRIKVKIPDLEREDPRLNGPLLSRIAKDTAAEYYVGLEAALGSEAFSAATGGPDLDIESKMPLVTKLKDRTRHLVRLTVDRPKFWQQPWLFYAMLGLCGLLFLEWTIRRLAKLA